MQAQGSLRVSSQDMQLLAEGVQSPLQRVGLDSLVPSAHAHPLSHLQQPLLFAHHG